MNARSPYIVTIDEVAQTNASVALRFKRFSDVSFPTDAQYIFYKEIPASNLVELNFNISPYVREFITNLAPVMDWTSWPTVMLNPKPETEYVQIELKKYSDGILLTTGELIGFDGFGYYADGTNPAYDVGSGADAGLIMLNEGTYYYHMDCTAPTTLPSTDFDYRAPNITMIPGAFWDVRHTNLVTGAVVVTALTSYENEVIDVLSVLNLAGYDDGFKVEFRDTGDVVKWTGYFRPQTENKYTPLVCDFINKYGAWQRTWFYKASNNTIEVMGSDYQLFQTDLTDYDIQEGNKQRFNINGKESIKVNMSHLTRMC